MKKEKKKINYWKVTFFILLVVLSLLVINNEYKKYYEIKQGVPELTCRYAVDVNKASCEEPVPVVCYYVRPAINPSCLQEDSLIDWNKMTWNE